MLAIFVRALVLYIFVIITMRIMGKRQIGQLQPFELAVAIMISELAAVPMQDLGIPLVHGIIPILTLLIAQLLMSFLSLKSVRIRALISGKPSILIENGKILENELQREMYTLNDLLEQLRIKDIADISDVEFAILETNGQLSIITKSQKRPVTPSDLNIPTEYEGLSYDIILDGRLMEDNLKKANLDTDWLYGQLAAFGITRVKDVLFASLDTRGSLYLQKKS